MKKRVIGSLLCLFVLFSMGAIATPWYVTSALHELSRLVELHRVEGLRRELVITMHKVQADLYTTHTVLGRRLDSIVASVENLNEAARECGSCHHAVAVERQLHGLNQLIGEYETALSYFITASANKERISGIQVEAASIGKRILNLSGEMSKAASQRLVDISSQARSRVNTLRSILLMTLGLAFCVSVAIASYLTRSVTRPVENLVGATRAIGIGQLGYRIEEEMEMEFAELAGHFNEMSRALKEGYDKLESGNAALQREIAERQRAERQREELQKQLLHAQKMQAIGTLSAGIAHEFNNYLQVIQGCTENLASRKDSGSPDHQELKIIDEAVGKAANLTGELLAFRSEERSKVVSVNMNEMVQRAKTILEKTLPRTIEIEISLTEDIGNVCADPVQIERVLLNLALNAREAMPQGGVLRLETSRDEPSKPRTEESVSGEPGEWIVLRISDTGHGMNEETLQRIFEPFFTTKEIGVGTGLGLATAYGIVTGCGGQISCRSQVGKGTVFQIRLPAVVTECEVIEADTISDEQMEPGHGSILLIDDEARMLQVTRDALEQHGYIVHIARTGEEAIEFFERQGHEVDLVLLDLRMPGMGGKACLKCLLQIKPDAKIVITTGHGTREQEREFLESGAFGFLNKPYRISEVASHVKAALVC